MPGGLDAAGLYRESYGRAATRAWASCSALQIAHRGESSFDIDRHVLGRDERVPTGYDDELLGALMLIENLNLPQRKIAVPKWIAVVMIAAQKFGTWHLETHWKRYYPLHQSALAARLLGACSNGQQLPPSKD
jgi:hypothetical protein